MFRLPRWFGLLVLILLGSGSVVRCDGRRDLPDIRERLLTSFRHGDHDFVHSAASYKLTRCAYVGKLNTAEGPVYVCDVRWVLKGMQAPRGFSFIVFSDRHLHYLGKIQYSEARPRRCDGGKLYLFGDIEVPPDPGWSNCPALPESSREGNVMDVSEGFHALRIYHKKITGSSSL